MKIETFEEFIPKEQLNLDGLKNLKACYASYLSKKIPQPHRIIKFVITKSDESGYYCEIDCLIPEQGDAYSLEGNIFDFRKRTHENTDKFISVLLIPTGIGAEIGGHSGDGSSISRLIATASDILITHPNVVNAADINEMTDNTEYVEGGTLTNFMLGKVGLQRVRQNKVLILMDKHKEPMFNNQVINMISAARITFGMNCDVRTMDKLIRSVPDYSKSGRAIGRVEGLEKLFAEIEKFKNDYDAIGLSTFIEVPTDSYGDYFLTDALVNPWGGIEAMLTHSVSETFHIPCAHAPMVASSDVVTMDFGVVDPRKTAEIISTTELYCVLKGLHRSPKIIEPTSGITLEDVSCVIIPDGCVGLPTLSCLENDIPLIVVKENKNLMQNDLRKLPFKSNKLFFVDSYLEAVGIMTALKAGISPDITRRPVKNTIQL